jgi:hypothetical protein
MIKNVPEIANSIFSIFLMYGMVSVLNIYTIAKNIRNIIAGILSSFKLMLGFAQIKQPRAK